MAVRKKRAKAQKRPAANPTAQLDAGWRSFIGDALKKNAKEPLWPDPAPPRKARATKKKSSKKRTKAK
jgi:hypothetical protein